ncbi:hypothetical protein THIOM_001199 [Candidatus Thiomargarita nelsonii]|uniref:Uncharacterized protein n=1 Tax=Candidatus Thiomargarita nelsonii TaxID=1003181 RepID=A0A176S4P4_9GAMM|nr:hypothetical protein THIOM_001199 [Candidatus Thiomargarita nelsonii]
MNDEQDKKSWPKNHINHKNHSSNALPIRRYISPTLLGWRYQSILILFLKFYVMFYKLLRIMSTFGGNTLPCFSYAGKCRFIIHRFVLLIIQEVLLSLVQTTQVVC